ncbi:hypothetical protein N7474_006504 [Penicillium riverlandense]|uniref:uncharacterized protein n=1 Tax=Penicillium riverlandense TaxID=1903569 RepID=UPI0025471564|nr:uncharacterized protein N7474_006504 [Penicillium riverlandense]KAJ5814727.1 hypothetical protein N7474_006504 [Penicillium riverlandense]
MAQFADQDFFGGAIRGVVPQGWIDGSTLREVPDHQELFLSPTTLSTLIIEINQRVPRDEALSTLTMLDHQQPPLHGSSTSNTASTETIDQAAALYHLHDVCEEGDTMQVVTPPQRVHLSRLLPSSSPSSSFPAYRGVVSFTTPSRQRPGGRVPSSVDGVAASTSIAPSAAVSGASLSGEMEGVPQTSRLTCHYLVVRLEPQATDLVVFLNVPHEEFDQSGDPRGLSKEEVVAEELIETLVQKLEVCDWGLFV